MKRFMLVASAILLAGCSVLENHPFTIQGNVATLTMPENGHAVVAAFDGVGTVQASVGTCDKPTADGVIDCHLGDLKKGAHVSFTLNVRPRDGNASWKSDSGALDGAPLEDQ